MIKKSKSYEALFINGVFEDLLKEMATVQGDLSEQILYLQPATGQVITQLRAANPSTEAPVRLFISTTDSLDTVSYEAEIVGWRDKRNLTGEEKDEIINTLKTFQKNEGRFSSEPDDGSVNLLLVRKMRRLTTPFLVNKLIKTSNGQPLSTSRSRSGGWSYVNLAEA